MYGSNIDCSAVGFVWLWNNPIALYNKWFLVVELIIKVCNGMQCVTNVCSV